MLKNRNLLLGLLLLLLAGFYFLTLRSDNKKGERNFKKDLVAIDTSRVNQILIYPETSAGEEIILERQSNLWKVAIADGKYADIDPASIAKVLRDLNNVDSKRLVTRSEEKYEDYQVNDSGTKVVAKDGAKTLIEMIIGKFEIDPRSIQGANSATGGMNPKFTSYMRLVGEKEVYAVAGFLEGSFNQNRDAYRVKDIWKGNPSEISSIHFNYPDSAFQLIKNANQWMIGNTVADSTEVAKYISVIPAQKGGAIMKDPGKAFGTIDYNFADGTKLTYTGHKNEKGLYSLSSSSLENAIWQGTTGAIYKRLFVSKSSFLK